MQQATPAILALDIGTRRVGVALARQPVWLPAPLATLEQSENLAGDVAVLAREHDVRALVVGLPRGLDGGETEQTGFTRRTAAALQALLPLRVHWQDEALTSVKAEEELKHRGKPYAKGDIDALAATYILEDFIREHPAVLQELPPIVWPAAPSAVLPAKERRL